MIGRRTRLLAHIVYGRLFENDLFSSSVSASNARLWLLAALASPGVMISASQYYFYAHARTFTPEAQDRILFVSQVFHVDFAMAVAGVVTMLVWTSLTPDRRDALVLGPLPIGNADQARARLLALVRFFVSFAAAVAVPTAVAFTFVTMGESRVSDVAARIGGHASSTLLGAGFVFFLLLDVQLVLAAALGPRAVAVATLPLQAAALGGMVGALSYTTQLADAVLLSEGAADPLLVWNPAAWFLGVYRWVSGDTRELYAALAGRGFIACGVVFICAVLAYPIAYRRCAEHAIAGEGQRARWWSGAFSRLWLRVLRPLLRTPLERGLASYIVATITRSHSHRFLIGSYVGVGALGALPFIARLFGFADAPGERYAWFSVPLGALCWTAAGPRVSMMLPVQPAANWIFKLTEPVDKRRVLSTTVKVLQSATAVPLALVFGVGAAVAGGPVLGVTVFAVVLSTGLALVEVMTLLLRTIPCTCTYRPGQLNLRLLWPVYLVTWLFIAYTLPNIALWALGDLARSIALVATLSGVWAAVHVWRSARAQRLRSFVYDEIEPSATTTIALSVH